MSDSVTISREEYEELIKDQEFLDALKAVGVDNWQGYEYACEAVALENS